MEIKDKFGAVDREEYCKFDRILNKKSNRPDLHAFILLDELFPANRDLISAAKHDEIWLDIDEDNLSNLTDEHILELTRCGVRYCSQYDCLVMFV